MARCVRPFDQLPLSKHSNWPSCKFAAGSAGQGAGLAFRLLESQYRLNIPRLFVALLMLCGTGIAIFGLTSFVSWLVLHRWHESAIRREN